MNLSAKQIASILNGDVSGNPNEAVNSVAKIEEGKKGDFWKKLQIFRKTGEPCPHCKKPITRIIVGQRSTHICENKQKIMKIPE